MADLGSLYFDILLRDKTAAERAKIKADLLKDLQLTLDLKVDTKTLAQQVRNDLQTHLQGHQFKINVVVDKATATQAVQQALAQVRTWNGKYTASDLMAEKGKTQQAIQQWKQAQAELARVKAAHLAAKDAANAHASASISLGNAMGANLTIAGKLGATMASLYSVHMAKDFLANVIEIGGELEHQKIAMDTIFGDKGKTIDLFGNIKDLARNSPFGVMELTKSVKALSAYGVEYNEIYDTAKRLADISAATSVDINRLILAFGKTKSRTFLDGLEAKQFAYANIPIYDMLSKKLTELEGKFVSVKDVMGRIKKREIGFDMVKEVLWDLTDEGGKFYDMQEALAGSVKTSWKLVKDNIELMYGELAETLAGPLKSTAEILQSLTGNWETVAWVVGAAAVQLGIFRLSAYATNLIMTKQTAITYGQIMADKKREAEMLKLSSVYQSLTIAERRKILTANRLTNEELRQLVMSEKLRQQDILRLIALRELDAEHIRFLMSIDMVDAKLVQEATGCRLVTLRLKALGIALREAARSARAFLTNPWTIGMAAISGIVALWQKNSQESEKAKEIGDDMFTKASEGAKNLHSILVDINGEFSKMSELELQQTIEKLENAIKDYHPFADTTIANAKVDEEGNLRPSKERAEILKQEVEYLEKANKLQEQYNIGSIVTNAIDAADSGWFDDNLTTDIGDYVNALNSAEKALMSYKTTHKEQAQEMLQLAINSDASFAAAVQNMSTWEEKFSLLVKSGDQYADAWGVISKKWLDKEVGIKPEFHDLEMLHVDWGGVMGMGELNQAEDEVKDELKQVLQNLKSSIPSEVIDFSKELTPVGKIILSKIADELFTGMEKLPQERQNELKAIFHEMFNFDFDNGVLTEAMREQMEGSFDQLGDDLAEKIRSGKKLEDAEKDKVKEVMKTMIPAIEKEFPHLAGRLQTLINNQQWVAQILLSFSRTAMLKDWQQALVDIWGDTPEIIAVIKAAPDVASAYEGLAELKKSSDEWLKKFGTIKLPVGFKYEPGKLFDVDKINALTDPIARQILLDANQHIETINKLTAGASTSGVNLSAWEKSHKKDKGNGNKKDKFAERIKERLNLLKDAHAEYKKWIEVIGKDEALTKVEGSGIFDKLFKGDKPSNIEDYKGELDKLLEELDKEMKKPKGETKERRELYVAIKKLRLDIDREELKDAAEEAKAQLENEIARIGKQWDLYKQLIDAGASRDDAGKFAFGVAPKMNSKAEALRDNIEKRLKEKGLDIPVTLSREEADDLFKSDAFIKAFGGKDSPLYKQIVKAWEEAKEAIEKDSLDIKIKEVKAINKYKSTDQKIKDLNESYGRELGLSLGEDGLLQEKDGMSEGQLARFREYQEEVAKLKGELLTLLPVWEQIFGDHTYQSYGQIEKAADVARQIVSNAKVQKNADGKPTIYTSSYTDKDGKIVNVSGQFSQLEKLKKAIDDLYKAGLQKNPFATLAKNIREVFKGKNGEMKDDSTAEKFAKIGESAAESAQMVGTFTNQMADMFDAMGEEGAADAMSTVGDAMNSVANIGQAFAKGGLIGGIAAAAGEAMGWISKIFQAHDKNLQKQIEKSQRAVKQMQNIYDAIERQLEFHLGSGKTLQLVDYDEDVRKLRDLDAKIRAIQSRQINFFDLAAISQYSKEAEKLRARVKAYDDGGAYGYQRQLMKEQLAELEKQRQLELDKKKTDQDAIDDYDAQIAEMRDQIRQFAEETAENLYGINVKEWASQLGDALFEAWKKGEDGAEAFKNTVADLMGDVMNSILKISILEPAMERLRYMLFGNDGQSGMFGRDFELDERELETIGDYLMGLSDKSSDYYEMLDKLDAYMKEKYGVTMRESDGDSSGLSKGIQSVTENTADLLASYINAIRADVSMKREFVRALVEDLFPQFNIIAEAQLRQLEQIAANTGRNAVAAEKILSLLNSNTNPGTGFKIS